MATLSISLHTLLILAKADKNGVLCHATQRETEELVRAGCVVRIADAYEWHINYVLTDKGRTLAEEPYTPPYRVRDAIQAAAAHPSHLFYLNDSKLLELVWALGWVERPEQYTVDNLHLTPAGVAAAQTF